jgi:hypothetical protein
LNKYQLMRQPQIEAFEVNQKGELQSKVLIGQDRLHNEPNRFKNKKPSSSIKKPVWNDKKKDWEEGNK